MKEGRIRLLRGEYEAGWAGYEHRLALRKFARVRERFDEPRWDGAPLAGQTILLHAEQGFGDTLQFIRYAPLVAARGGAVAVECPPSLASLVGSVEGVARVIEQGAALPPFACQAPLLSLPRILATDMDSIPADIPYLAPPPGPPPPPLVEAGEGFRVGIVWAGNPDHADDRNRSCGLAAFAPLRALGGVRLYGLQVGPRAADLQSLPPGPPVIDLSPWLSDFAATARAMQALDLIVTVDSAPAHLAGALGRPAWVLLPFVPDWRWLLERDDSPWYPSLRLFRQPTFGDWPAVFERVAASIATLTRRPGG